MSKSAEDIKFILQYTAKQYETNGSYHPANPVSYAQGLRDALVLIESLSIQQEADAKDATHWREWMPWMRQLNKKPFNLTKLIAQIDRDTAMATPTDSEK